MICNIFIKNKTTKYLSLCGTKPTLVGWIRAILRPV